MTKDFNVKDNHEKTKQFFSDYLEKNGYRKTPERFSILKQICDTEGHFDIEFLYIKMKNNNCRVSRATLYNAIELLLDCNIVIKHQFDKNVAQYEKAFRYQQHDHIICTKCGKVFEFKDPRLEDVQKSIEKHMKFYITNRAFNLYGICYNCLQSKNNI